MPAANFRGKNHGQSATSGTAAQRRAATCTALRTISASSRKTNGMNTHMNGRPSTGVPSRAMKRT
jgi:hypothetical protein